MTKKERDQAAMLLGALAEVLGQEMTDARLALLLEEYDNIPFAKFKTGIALARRRCRFIPAPVDFRAMCNEAPPPALGPSLAALRAERAKVRDSWKGGPPVPTLQAMVDSCYQNALLAEQQAQAARDAINRRQPGDEAIPQLRMDVERHLADYRHWSSYVGYYRARVAKEGADTVPKVSTDPLGGIVGIRIGKNGGEP